GDGLHHGHVHPAVRPRPPARLDRPVPGDDQRPDDEDRPPPPGVHRRGCPRLRRHREPLEATITWGMGAVGWQSSFSFRGGDDMTGCPVEKVDGAWVVRGHRAATQVALDDVTYSSAVSRFLQVPNGMDGAEHDAFRALTDRYLTHERV